MKKENKKKLKKLSVNELKKLVGGGRVGKVTNHTISFEASR